MQSTPLLPSLPGQFWPSVVAPDRVLSMGQIELNCNHALLNSLKLTVFTFNCKVKLATLVVGDPKAPFSISTRTRRRGGRYSIPRINWAIALMSRVFANGLGDLSSIPG